MRILHTMLRVGDTTSPYQASIDAMTAMIDNAAGQPFKLRGMVTDYQVVDGGPPC